MTPRQRFGKVLGFGRAWHMVGGGARSEFLDVCVEDRRDSLVVAVGECVGRHRGNLLRSVEPMERRHLNVSTKNA